MKKNRITSVKKIVDRSNPDAFQTYEEVGLLLGMTSGRSIRRWVELGRLPRTELTGETAHAEILETAKPAIDAAALRLEIRNHVVKQTA